jgi:hypothetical protein
MKRFTLLLLPLLAACSSVEVIKVPFPEPPPKLMVSPEPLKTIKDMQRRFAQADFTNTNTSEIKLNDVVKSVVTNYGICHEYKEQILSLQEWINMQKKANP